MTSEERGFLDAIKTNPDDVTARGAYADWLDEHDRHHDAMLQSQCGRAVRDSLQNPTQIGRAILRRC